MVSNLLLPSIFLPLPMQERVNFNASKRAVFVKNIHNRDRVNIEKITKLYEKRANKGRKKMLFEPGDLVWVHLRKDRFPEQCKCKLQPRANGPFKVLLKINDNAYEIDLPNTYSVSTSFNVSDLSLFYGSEESRTTPFQEGEDDKDIPTVHATSSVKNSPSNIKNTNQAQVFDGPITRSRAKKLQQEVNALLCEIYFNINENYILPKSCMLLLLRFTKENDKNTKGEDYREGPHSNPTSPAE